MDLKRESVLGNAERPRCVMGENVRSSFGRSLIKTLVTDDVRGGNCSFWAEQI